MIKKRVYLCIAHLRLFIYVVIYRITYLFFLLLIFGSGMTLHIRKTGDWVELRLIVFLVFRHSRTTTMKIKIPDIFNTGKKPGTSITHIVTTNAIISTGVMTTVRTTKAI